MYQEQIIFYIRQHLTEVEFITAGIAMLLLFAIFIRVVRTGREVHAVCKKVRRYFEVILADAPETENTPESAVKPAKEDAFEQTEIPVYERAAARENIPSEQSRKTDGKDRSRRQDEQDMRLVMDVIREVF